MKVKAWEPASDGSAPRIVPAMSGAIWKAVSTVASFTAPVNVTTRLVVGAIESPTTVDAVILPEVTDLVRNEVSVGSPSLRPSRSSAVAATSTVYYVSVAQWLSGTIDSV